MQVIISWVLAFMVAHAPPGVRVSYPEAIETVEDATQRYESIARDLVEVAFDPKEQPIFSGDNGRAKTAALLASIAFWEGGGYRRDIDYGIGPHARGDHGNSVCLMQINIGNRKTIDGYTMADLLADRKKCFRAGLHMAQYSFRACERYRPTLAERLRIYTSGSCQRGSSESLHRVMTGMSWFYDHRPRFTDDEVLRFIRAQRDAQILAARQLMDGPSPLEEGDEELISHE